MHFVFADSEVAQCHWADGQLRLRFSAAQLVDTQSPDAEVLWAPLLLTADAVEPWETTAPDACMGRLRQGSVLYASQRMLRLPVPCELEGVVTLELEFAQGGIVHARCESLSLHPLQATAVKAYQC